MPSRDLPPLDALLHIRENIELARRFVEGYDYEKFLDTPLVFYAVTRALEIISEASRKLGDELKSRHANIPWKDMAGAGNVYRHDYEDVRHRLVWGAVHNRLPALLVVVEQELERIGEAFTTDRDRHSPS